MPVRAGTPRRFTRPTSACNVTLVDTEANPGGVCLYRGCIPVQGAAARREARRRSEARDGVGRDLRRAEDRPRQAARVQGQRRRQADRRPRRSCRSSARSRTSRARRRSSTRRRSSIEPRQAQGGGEKQVDVRARDHRDRLAADDRFRAFRPTAPRVMDSTGGLDLPDDPEDAARRRRRLHRPRARHRSTRRSAPRSPSSK